MKKFLTYGLGLFFMFIWLNSVFADSSMYDYTYVDCNNGNDNTAEPFNHTKPYNTLQAWVQNSINYITSNWNIPANADAVVWKRFVIKAKAGCVFDGTYTNAPYIITTFLNGNTYKNDILITSDDDSKAFGIKNCYFADWGQGAGNIVFSNIDFMTPYGGSYYLQYSSRGIRIQNSLIRLSNGQSLWYQYQSCGWYGCSTVYQSNAIIENSIIKITWWSWDTGFTIPWYVKNSKIEFTVPDWQSGRLVLSTWYNTLNLLTSNIIDAWGQDFYSNTEMINNKIINVKSASFAGGFQVFVNNFVQNATPFSMNTWNYSFNNIFTGGYADPSDTSNFRRNFSSTQSNVGVGWIYKKALGTYFEANFSDQTLYKEMTGNDLWNTQSPVYLIFQ